MARPSVTRALRAGVDRLDRHAATIGVLLERPALLAFLFHAVFDNEREIDSGTVHPQEAITVAGFRGFVEHLLEAGYRFVDLDDIEGGLDPSGRFAFVTFDDGYANNTRIVPTLAEYGVPATIFVSTSHVQYGRRFWWDVVYAERRQRGMGDSDIEREISFLKSLAPQAIDAHLVREFGDDALRPRGELDRPLGPDELRQLAAEPSITIGNHTTDHAILTVLSSPEIEAQVVGAQRYLEALLGTPPRMISYPNGNYDRRVLTIASDAGLTWGITTIKRKERIPIRADRRLQLGRFQLRRDVDVRAQLDVLRSRIQLSNTARRLRSLAGTR